MAVILSSIFRDASTYVDRWYEQTQKLAAILNGEPLQLIVAEGDSQDPTYETLASRLSVNDLLLKIEHGGPRYPSIDHPGRWAQIAAVCNGVLEEVQDRIGPDDRWIYVESDLVWNGEDLAYLLGDLEIHHVPAVASMSMRGWEQGKFYDIWGHVGRDGRRFRDTAPYHDTLEEWLPGRLVEILSAGSCWAATSDGVKAMRFGEEDCVRGIGRSLRAAGLSLWLDPSVAVVHPPIL